MGSEQKRVFLAVVLSGLVLISWQMFFAPQKPITTPVKEVSVAQQSSTNNEAQASTSETTITSETVVEKSSLELRNEDHVFKIFNNLAIENIENKNAVFDFRSIAGSPLPFQVFLLSGSKEIELFFESSDENRSHKGLRGYNAEYGINLFVDLTDNGKLEFVLKSSVEYAYKFKFFSEKEEKQNQSPRQFIIFKADIDRITVGDEDSGDGSVRWFGIDYNYHLFALVSAESIKARYYSNRKGDFSLETVVPRNEFKGYLVFTKKNYDDLVSLGDKLDLSVDFGFFGIIAVPILRGLQFFYDLIPNYGVAIILLTILIRFILFPLQWKSFKSMKKMQVLSPELQKIREKFKEDPQRMQKETMDLFKRSGANPLGGCLPLLMQMPIFFAFYQVLYNAVELVGAPFAWWIVDLSIKDPYYVLPILMGISMVLQQKMTPTATMDATQRKIMMIMPLVFTFIMKDLPAGLNLYIFISTVFGIIQQLIVYKTTE